MKVIRRNLMTILVVMIASFGLLGVYLGYDILVFGNRWVNSPYNTRLSEQRSKVTPGDIIDCQGVVLATTDSDGQRQYLGSRTDRLALCHLIGDRMGYCATGIETFHASTLLGYDSGFLAELLDALENKERRGQDVTTTVDSAMQIYAAELMGDQHGAVVLLNYRTGDILTMLSTPGFDMADNEAVKEAAAGDDGALLNRATQGRFAPGSTFKVVVAAAALEHGVADENWYYTCTGSVTYDGSTLTCPRAHGELTLEEAFAVSCNCAFASLGVDMGADALVETAEDLSFNRDFLYEDLTLYDSQITRESLDSDIALARASIGQHEDLATPMHMALIAATVANGGVMPELDLVDTGGRVLSMSTKSYQALKESTTETLKQMMAAVITDGTGTAADISADTVYGKTGSAQVGGDKESHAWFIGFTENSPLAICVMVENGGGGGSVAAPIAGKLLAKAIESGY